MLCVNAFIFLNQTYLQVTAEESLSGVQNQALIEVIRGPGVFGSVSVQYQLN